MDGACCATDARSRTWLQELDCRRDLVGHLAGRREKFEGDAM